MQARYREILEAIGRRPDECLMVGDNWGWDVVCAGTAGIPSYWIAMDGARPPEPVVPVVGRGDLDDLLASAESGVLERSWMEYVGQGLTT